MNAEELALALQEVGYSHPYDGDSIIAKEARGRILSHIAYQDEKVELLREALKRVDDMHCATYQRESTLMRYIARRALADKLSVEAPE